MPPHHSYDYKLTAVKYYLSKNEDMRDVCKIFKCSYKSLSRWVNQYQEKFYYNILYIYNVTRIKSK